MAIQFNLDKWESEIDGAEYKFRYWNTDDNDHVLSINGEILPLFRKSFAEKMNEVCHDFCFDNRNAVLVLNYGEAADVAIDGVLLRSGQKWQRNKPYAWVWPSIGFLTIMAGMFFIRDYPVYGTVHLIGIFIICGVFKLPGILRTWFGKVFRRHEELN